MPFRIYIFWYAWKNHGLISHKSQMTAKSKKRSFLGVKFGIEAFHSGGISRKAYVQQGPASTDSFEPKFVFTGG